MKSTEAQFIFLGTGGSMGIPVLGCSCDVCTSVDVSNKRLRPSALLKIDNKIFLIDCGPDFRFQGLKQNLTHIDGILVTHAHHDHTAGLDDLRIFSIRSGKSIPCLLSQESLDEIKTRFYYFFREAKSPNMPKVTTNLSIDILEGSSGTKNFEGLKIHYASYRQGGMRVDGFRLGNLAYVTDIKEYSPDIFQMLEGVDILILSALRFTPSHLHFTVDEAIEFAQKVGAKQTWLTHIAHELDHERTNAYLPKTMSLGYDGLELSFQAELY